jgi:Outer membrane protein beta-barrel domain
MKSFRILLSLIFVLTLFFASQEAYSQGGRRGKPYKSKPKNQDGGFSDSQWWLGFKIGGNTTSPTLLKSYDLFSSTSGQQLFYEKDYEGFRRVGVQAGGMFVFSFKSLFSLSLQPTYSSMNWGYKTTQSWTDGNNQAVQIETKNRIVLNYLEIPLLLRYDILQTRLHPYVQAGAWYGRLLKADKYVSTTSFDQASGATNPIDNQAPIIGAKNLFITSNWGFILGGGVSFDVGNVRIGADLLYKQGLNNITNAKNRYSDNRQIGLGDVFDDVSLKNVELSMHVMFPLKFLQTKAFKRT